MPVAALRVVLVTAAVLVAGTVRAGEAWPLGEAGALPAAGRDRLGLSLLPDSATGPLDDGSSLLAPRFSDRSLDADSPRRRGLLSLDWQHALSDAQSLAVSAQYGDYGYGYGYGDADAPSVGVGRAAAVSWSALLGGEGRLSGQLFLGDESAREPDAGLLARRYYGLLLEGRYALGRDHVPFASLRWQRSDIDNGDGSAADWRRASESRFAAGWSWQISPDWDLRAEASYRFLEDAPELIETDRARFGLSTQYGFR